MFPTPALTAHSISFKCFLTVLDYFQFQVTELFTVHKSEMEKCKTNLQVREKELEDTQKHLETTKVLLEEEVYIASALENTEEKLHGTAIKVNKIHTPKFPPH